MVTLFCFAFFSVQKSRPDASKSNYVIDGVRGILRACLGNNLPAAVAASQQRDHSGSLRYFLYFFNSTTPLSNITQHG